MGDALCERRAVVDALQHFWPPGRYDYYWLAGAALATARAFPDLRLVIDHLAKPPIASGEIAAWANFMEPFRKLTQVTCKLSGMITEADWATWQPDDLRPYVHRVLDVFGVERVMYGSDWPVCLLAGGYAAVKSALEEALPPLSDAERQRIFGGTAIEFYQLPLKPRQDSAAE